MSTQQTASISITNRTDGTAYIQLFHRNASNGTQNASWVAPPGATVGPMTVRFQTGWGSYGILDYWSVVMGIEGGSTPGTYQNTGSVAIPQWKECQLQDGDAGKHITLSVNTKTFDVSLDSGGCSNDMKRLGDFSRITNVFVLMLENHSFDNIFGQSGIPGITHATPADANAYDGTMYHAGSSAPLSMPTDPGHEFPDVVEQLCGPGTTFPHGGPYPDITNSGFAANYATTADEKTGLPTPAEIGDIMLGFDTPSQLPVSYQLATEFAICDHWFASMPGPTWPNRFFVHGASSVGLDHSPAMSEILKWEAPGFGFAYPKGSIYQKLSAAGLGWRLYADKADAYSDDPQNGSVFGAIPQVSALKGVTLLDIHSMTDFAADLQAPYPSQYTFIEPNYGDITGNTYVGGSSQHPMDDVYGGEGLIKAVYEAIRNSPVWNTSLLIVTYDEHGGFYDSVPPPPCVAPNDGSSSKLNTSGFGFDRYGVRVPAVIVSPWIAPGGVVDTTVYDHSSVLATVEKLFGLCALTDRDAAAHNVLGLLTLSAPRDDAPRALVPQAPARLLAKPKPEELAAHDDDPIDLSGNLPGFLGAALKTEIELAQGDVAQQQSLIAEYQSIRTRGDARKVLARASARAEAARAGGPAGPA